VAVQRDRFIDRLLDLRILSEREALDDDQVAKAAAEIIAAWAEK
jgi:hypothetical protein